MRICLLNPKYESGQKAHRIPLGLSYIASMLTKYKFEVYGYNLDVDPLPDFSSFDLIGVYLSTPMLKTAIPLLKQIKATTNAVLVIGGPHISANPQTVQELNAVGIVGEGEYPFLNIAYHVKSGDLDFSDIDGVAYLENNKVMINPPANPSNLNDLPFPNKTIFDNGNYPDKQFAYSAIVASRGCPFDCRNCQPGLKRVSSYRIRNPKQVVKEMNELYTGHKVTDFSFEDSELIISKNWTLEFCDQVIRNFNSYGINITFQANARLHQLDDDVLAALKKAGCRRLGIGVESGSQRVIDQLLNKQINLATDLPNLNMIKKHGIESQVWIMIGIPGETEEEIRQTINMAKTLNVSTIEINIATPWPGTYFYDDAKSQGWIKDIDMEDFDEKHRSVFNTPFLSASRVQELFEEFKAELRSSGWIKWSHETNTFARKPSGIEIFKRAVSKIRRKEIFISDLCILKDWVKCKLKWRGHKHLNEGAN